MLKIKNKKTNRNKMCQNIFSQTLPPTSSYLFRLWLSIEICVFKKHLDLPDTGIDWKQIVKEQYLPNREEHKLEKLMAFWEVQWPISPQPSTKSRELRKFCNFILEIIKDAKENKEYGLKSSPRRIMSHWRNLLTSRVRGLHSDHLRKVIA
jgi:hypothetical protein